SDAERGAIAGGRRPRVPHVRLHPLPVRVAAARIESWPRGPERLRHLGRQKPLADVGPGGIGNLAPTAQQPPLLRRKLGGQFDEHTFDGRGKLLRDVQSVASLTLTSQGAEGSLAPRERQPRLLSALLRRGPERLQLLLRK